MLSLTRRSVLVGIILNPAYVGAALIGIGGALSLNWRIMAISLVMSFALFVCFIIFVILNYVGSVRADDGQAWVVLALFLPGLVVDIAVVALCIPSVQKLRATELVASSSGISIVQAATRASAVVPSSAGAQVAPAMASVQSAMASVQSAPPEDAPRQCTVCMDRSPNTGKDPAASCSSDAARSARRVAITPRAHSVWRVDIGSRPPRQYCFRASTSSVRNVQQACRHRVGLAGAAPSAGHASPTPCASSSRRAACIQAGLNCATRTVLWTLVVQCIVRYTRELQL